MHRKSWDTGEPGRKTAMAPPPVPSPTHLLLSLLISPIQPYCLVWVPSHPTAIAIFVPITILPEGHPDPLLPVGYLCP